MAQHMRWHVIEENPDGRLRHLRDLEAWKTFDAKFLDFTSDPRNLWQDSFRREPEWTGDVDNGLFSPIENSKSKLSVSAKAPAGKAIPYSNARLSRSEFFYSFPVTNGQKFIRLYFYPSSYGVNFLRSDSLFSIRAGSHTLLKDFNASFAADDAGQETILREYCVDVYTGETLSLTITPSLSDPNTYAFINGIEVISMPTFLYYTNPDDLQGMTLDGGTQQYQVKNNKALETMYRVNVGGSHIPPEKDTGMFRYWDQDNAYLERERPHSVSAGFGLEVDHTNYPNYTAPDEVYLTARSYGMKETSKFNVTWEFEVDSEFTYTVRLHFCEFDEKIQNNGDRVFQIFINDALVEPVADVMMWTHKVLAPIHKDYAVSMPSDDGKLKLNLSIKLRPHPLARSTYRDVLLNGIEILKISTDYNDNHASPSSNPLQSPSTPSSRSSRNGNKAKEVHGGDENQ
ncbi:receptor-like protein kinase FERONIA [Neltuma alba]|uniref:receptor-like protein kinase FERONIA n=1 Tax=Neltuma alba TaxID=207710 RepID=UPI0010A3B168|nr:receptor-like protein kinase FERONIA [Prosopis alba]